MIDGLLRDGYERAGKNDPVLMAVKAVNISPAVLGGASGATVERGAWVGLRPTSLRGVWRWWVRAILSALLWESEYNLDYKGMAKLEAKIGLGSVIEDKAWDLEEAASDIYLEVRSRIKGHPLPQEAFRVQRDFIDRRGRVNCREILRSYLRECCSDLGEYWRVPWKFLLSIPRYQLITVGLRPCSWGRRDGQCLEEALYERQPIPPGLLEVRVVLKSRRGRGSEWSNIYGAALLLALSMGGLGQITSRGFGKFRVEVDDAPPELKSLRPEELHPGRILDILRSIQDELVGKIPGERYRSKVGEEGPYIPTYHPDVCRFKMVDVELSPSKGARHVWDALVVGGQACLKINWKLLMGGSYRISGRKLHTWPLGLPRYVLRGRIGTGYAFIERDRFEGGRLPSLIRISPIDESGKRAIVYGFFTRDLREAPDKGLLHLNHLGGRKPVVKIPVVDPRTGKELADEYDPQRAFDVAFETVSELISKGGSV